MQRIGVVEKRLPDREGGLKGQDPPDQRASPMSRVESMEPDRLVYLSALARPTHEATSFSFLL
ncbi:hypothetical protein BDV36DRAFT_256092, partial [Aspergillus pseudocaelatus]